MDIGTLFPAIAIELSFGFIAGIIVGYTCKKLTRLVAIVLGLFFIGIQILAYYKFIYVDWQSIGKATEGAIKATTASTPLWWAILITHFPYVGAFSIGFVIGFRKG
jgi:uncharacterized membrane protein (Fun14 family)